MNGYLPKRASISKFKSKESYFMKMPWWVFMDLCSLASRAPILKYVEIKFFNLYYLKFLFLMLVNYFI